MSAPISVDFETFYDSKQGYGIKELGVWRYLHDDRFDPYLIAVSDGADSWAGTLKDFNWDALSGATLLSHNKYFDAMVYESAVEKNLAPRIVPKEWHCTANLSVYLCNRRSLADAAEFLLGVTLSKATRDYANGKTAKDIIADGRWEEMLTYGRSDAFNCQQLFTKHGHLWPEKERQLSEQTIAQGTRGVQIDRAKLDRYIFILHEMRKNTENLLPWIEAGSPPTSPKAIAEECRKVGIPGPPVKSREGEDAFIQWEANYGEKYSWIASVANWRSINKVLDSLETIKTRLTPENVLCFGLKYFGAHTGRWSGDAGINMQNFRKEPLFQDEKGLLISDIDRLVEIEQTQKQQGIMPPFVSASVDVRSLIIPREGKKMIVSDLSQIEPRVLAWVTDNKPMLESMAAGQSPYEAFARASMGWTGGDLKKEDKDRYALSKAQVLGLGYQCAWEKFIVVAQTMAGIDITKDDPETMTMVNEDGQPCLNADGTPKTVSGHGFNSRRIVAEFRQNNPLTTGLWAQLDAAFKGSVGDTFEMELPSGRKMIYRHVRKEVRTQINPKTKLYERKYVVVAEVVKNGMVAKSPLYGGLLTENLVQATARDVFAEHLLALDATPGVRVLFSSHDEAICEVDNSVSAKDIEAVMSRTPEWLAGCPIAAEAKEVPHYLK